MLNRLMSRFQDQSIRTKLGLGLGLLVVLVLAVGIVSQVTGRIEDREFENLQRAESELNAADQIVVEFVEARRNEKDFLLNYQFEGYQTAYDSYFLNSLTHIANVLTAVNDFRAVETEQNDLDDLDTVETFIVGYRVSLLQVIEDAIPHRGSAQNGLIGDITASIEFVDDESEDLGAAEIHLAADELQNAFLQYQLNSPPGTSTATDEETAAFNESLSELRQAILAADILPARQTEFLTTIDTVEQQFGELLELDADIAAEFTQFENIAAALQPLVTSLAADSQAEVVEAQVAFADSQQVARVIEIGAIIVAFVFALLLIFFINRGVVKPIEALIVAAGQFADENYAYTVKVRNNDEIGRLGRAFNEMGQIVRVRDEYLKVLNAQLEQRIVEVDKARAEAEQANKVKSQFLASVSHELRTPLNAILNFTKFVATGRMGEVNERQISALQNVIISGDHLLNLINDVLDISKIESGALSLFIKPDVDLKKELERTVETAQSLVANKSVKLVTQIDDNLPLLTGDELRLYQVMLNLISNACKFTKEGEIRVRAYQENGNIVVAIKDTGPGIPLEDQERIFSAFVQSESGLRDGTGTGLGLPIARRLTEAHGGRLWLNSEVGKGTTFFVSLPIENQLQPTQV